MKSISFKILELLIIFVLIPVSFTIDFSPWIKFALGVFGFAYVIYVLLFIEKMPFKFGANLNWRQFWRHTFIKLLLISILTTVFVWFTEKELLFHVVINKPKLWLLILFIYSVFSVYPQELLYRTFFFKRYEGFMNNNIFAILNAVLFSIGHLFFKNTLVLILTFFGGILFAFTFSKTHSTLLVSVEHAIYGSWLFTVGMGDMLGFPS